MENAQTKKMKFADRLFSNNLYISLLIFAVAFVMCAIIIPAVLQPTNIINVLRMNSISGVMAIGMTMVMLAGEIDLSVGAILSLSVSVGALAISAGQPELGFVITLLVGLGAGFVNGIIVAKSRVASLMVTLGMMSVYGGLANIVANGQATYLYDAQLYLDLGKGALAGIPIPVVVFLLGILIFSVLMSKTKFGKQVYYTGANSKAAYLAGIKTGRIKVAVFMLSGLCAAFAGPMLAAQVNRIIPTIGAGYEVTAIAVAVLGGTSLDGGKGSIIGTLLGVLTLGFLSNALALSGMGTYVEAVLQGFLIIGIVVIFEFARRRAK